MKQTLLITFLSINIWLIGQTKPTYQIEVHQNNTVLGNINIELFPDLAPNHCAYFDSVATNGEYDSTAFHRVISGFVIQGGDPNTIAGPDSTWGMGDPSQPNVDAEFNAVPYRRGVLGAARSDDPNSASSQYFICHGDAFFLNENYTAYGHVYEGLDVVDQVATTPTDNNDLPLDKVIVFITYTGENPSLLDSTILITEDSLTDKNYFINLEWELNPEALFYEIQLSREEDFSVIEESKTAPDGDVLFTNLELEGIRYYWRVIAYDGAKSVSSETRTFTTKFTSGVENQIQEPIQFYSTNNGLSLSSIQDYEMIAVFDLNGKMIHQEPLNSTFISLPSLESGIYVVKLMNSQSTLTAKVWMD